jgi:hypothetical protein
MSDPTDDLPALRDWLSTRPDPAAVRAMGARFDVRDPGAVTREQLVRLAAEVYPDALVDLLPSMVAPDPMEQPLYAVAGEALGAACARRKLASPEGLYAGALQLATVEAQGAYLRDARTVLHAYEVRELGRWLSARAAALPDWIKQAYAAALIACVPRLQKHERDSLFPFAALLDAAAIEGLLRASAKRAGHFDLALARLVAQGHPQCADGVAALLSDKKHGRVAAAALASMGAEGARAAHALLDAAGAKPTAATELARTLVSLPLAPHSLWAGEQWSLPRFGRDPRVDLRAPSGAAPARRHEPTPLAAIERAVTESPGRDLLSPEGWADLIQLLALDPLLANVSRAYERALAAGRLGLGADPDALTAALDAMRWNISITKHHPSHGWGVGWALLWAGAERSVFVHAIARFELCLAANVLGAREHQFGNALKALRPPWAPSVETLLRHYGADRDETAWRGPPAVLSSLGAPSAEVELSAPSTDLWILGCVRGASRFTVRLRKYVTLTVDVAAERWTVSTPEPFHGATPPLDASRGVRFAVEIVRKGMYVGVDGALIHGAFTELDEDEGPLRVTAEGDGALVTELELREKFSARASEAAGALFVALDSAQGYTEVAGQRSPAAAHCLAAAALLLDEPRASLARAALLTMEGDAVEPWKQRVRDGALAPAAAPEADAKKPRKGTKAKAVEEAPAVVTDVAAPTAFARRSFEDVVRVLHDLRLGVKARSKKPAVLRRGQTDQGDYEYASFAPSPASEDWSARAAVPYPVVYLSEEAPPLDDIEGFVDELSRLPGLCSKGRGASADVRYCLDGDRFLVAALQLIPGGDDDYGPMWSDVLAASWRVDEGWCWALLEGDEEPLRKLIGVQALPPQVEWKRASRVTVGNW